MLTSIQKEILIGLMLGDGSLELPKKGKNATLRITRTRSDSDYIDYHIKIFTNLGAVRSDGQVKDKRTGKTYLRSMLRTKCLPVITQLRYKWYPKGIKSLPNDLQLTPLILATWFADDGSMTIKKRNFTAKLATHGFTKPEVQLLRTLLKKSFDLDFKIYQDNSGKVAHWFLMLTNKQSVRNLIKIINPMFPEGMARKSSIWENGAELLLEKQYPQCKFCTSSKTYKNGSNQKGQAKYMCKNCKRQFTISFSQ